MLLFLYLTEIYLIRMKLKSVVLVFSEYNCNTIESFDLKFCNIGSSKKT